MYLPIVSIITIKYAKSKGFESTIALPKTKNARKLNTSITDLVFLSFRIDMISLLYCTTYFKLYRNYSKISNHFAYFPHTIYNILQFFSTKDYFWFNSCNFFSLSIRANRGCGSPTSIVFPISSNWSNDVKEVQSVLICSKID